MVHRTASPVTPDVAPHVLELFHRLDQYEDQIPVEVLTEQLRRIRITPDDIRAYISFNPDHYQRNRIYVGRAFHALALCWSPGQHSVIHDHRGSGCGLKVITGRSEETAFERDDHGMLRPVRQHHLDVGDVCVSVDTDIHRLTNPETDADLVTLHIYTPPLVRATMYRLDSPEVDVWEDREFLADDN